MNTKEIESLSLKETFKRLKSSPKGLTSEGATTRLKEYGYNEVKEKKQSRLLKLLSKFYGPVPGLLWIVIFLSYLLYLNDGLVEHLRDIYIILILLTFNAIVSFFEEYRADRSVEILNHRLAIKPRVLRSGEWQHVHAKMIVPGDILRVRFGDIMPADLKVIESQSLEIDESVITGESLPIEKHTNSILYEGSLLKRGEATCITINTGTKTFYGKAATLLSGEGSKPHLQEVITKIAEYLILADIIVIIIMLIYGNLILHVALNTELPFLLVVFIASVPISLPTAFTVTMSLGTEKLSKKSILVRRLDAVDDTALMNVLCIDKTGTLTQNKIVVKEVAPIGSTREEVIRCAAEASRKEDRDPIDNAILQYSISNFIKLNKQVMFEPFDPSTKRTEALIKGKERYYVVKGAILAIEKLCNLDKKERLAYYALAERFSKQGYRSLAVARGNLNKKFRLAGIIALYDEPRHEAKELLKELSALGIETKMITGDTIAVASHLANELNMKGEIVDINDIKKLSGNRLIKKINSAIGFANVYPQDKYTIVRSLQKENMIVGMTGDGINDTPALKQAEVGIAVSSATYVAKSVAALVLTRSGINVINDAIKESRKIFERMVTYTMTKIARVFQIIVFVVILFVALNGFISITPFLLILLILTNDIANISVSTDNVNYSNRPDAWHIKAIMYPSMLIGFLLVLEALILTPINLYAFKMTISQFQTATFLLLNITDKFTMFNLREKRSFWRSRPSNSLILTSFIGVIIGIILSYYGIFISSIALVPIITIVVLSTVFFILNDFIKVAALRFFGFK